MRVRIAVSALILLTTVAAVALSSAVFDTRIFPSSPRIGAQNAFNTRNLVRLHVVANSDSDDDQALKLEVRDAVLARARELLDSVRTKEEAWRVLLENAGEIQTVATDCVRAFGKPYGARVEMGTFAFPERTYGSVTVPRGDYDAVRVVLGDGNGRNWWCVLFPPLCFIQLNTNKEVEGLKLDLSPGDALAKLRLDLAGPVDPRRATGMSGVHLRHGAGIAAWAPAVRTPVSGSACLSLPLALAFSAWTSAEPPRAPMPHESAAHLSLTPPSS